MPLGSWPCPGASRTLDSTSQGSLRWWWVESERLGRVRQQRGDLQGTVCSKKTRPGVTAGFGTVGTPPGRSSPVLAGSSHICPHCIPQGLLASLGTGPTLFRPQEASDCVRSLAGASSVPWTLPALGYGSWQTSRKWEGEKGTTEESAVSAAAWGWDHSHFRANSRLFTPGLRTQVLFSAMLGGGREQGPGGELVPAQGWSSLAQCRETTPPSDWPSQVRPFHKAQGPVPGERTRQKG